MNINIFFLAIIGGLFMIYIGFKPIDTVKNTLTELPVLELEKFKLTELNTQGLTSTMNGSSGFKYKDRYLVLDINYTDNTSKLLSNIKADQGIDKKVYITLIGNIQYTREDGLQFDTQKANYNKKDTIMRAHKYVSIQGKHRITGTYLEYNNEKGKTKSNNVVAKYNLQER